MASDTRTTTTKAKNFTRISKRSRPATSGNKNVNARASRRSGRVPDRLTSPIKGPDRGNG